MGSYGSFSHATMSGQRALGVCWVHDTPLPDPATLPVAVKMIGLPLSVPDAAVTVFTPAVVPKVRTVEASPALVVVTEDAVSDPPPAVTAKVTSVPETGLP